MSELTRIRLVKSENFTVINNSVLLDKTISLKAKGLVVTVMGLPPSWGFSVQGLVAIVKEGVDAIYSALKELEEAGYVQRQRVYEEGKIKCWEYVFFEERQDTNLLRGFPDVGFPDVENPEVLLNKHPIKETSYKRNNGSPSEAVHEVFEEWVRLMSKPPQTKLTDERRDKIKARLKSFSVDQLKKALVGVTRDPFYMGLNDVNRPYNDLMTVFRNDSKVEEFLEIVERSPLSPVRVVSTEFVCPACENLSEPCSVHRKRNEPTV
jgi:hypothetical protein